MSLGGNSDEGKISELVQKIIPVAEVKSNASGELIFSLPAADSKSFGDLFESLERSKVEFDIGNFGLSITTMEDVFLRFISVEFVIKNSIKPHHSVLIYYIFVKLGSVLWQNKGINYKGNKVK